MNRVRSRNIHLETPVSSTTLLEKALEAAAIVKFVQRSSLVKIVFVVGEIICCVVIFTVSSRIQALLWEVPVGVFEKIE